MGSWVTVQRAKPSAERQISRVSVTSSVTVIHKGEEEIDHECYMRDHGVRVL